MPSTTHHHVYHLPAQHTPATPQHYVVYVLPTHPCTMPSRVYRRRCRIQYILRGVQEYTSWMYGVR